MKTLNLIKNYGLAMVAMVLMITTTNAQARYKHVPRVKTEGTKIDKQDVKEQTNSSVSTVAYVNAEDNQPVVTESAVNTENIENTSVASTSDENTLVSNTKITIPVKHNKVTKSHRNPDKNIFTKKIKEKSRLMEVKDVKKSLLAKWLLYMIICLAAALLFTILAVIFGTLLITNYGLLALYYIFWALAGIAYIGAVIFLILGLTGVM